jgi:SAM-dependent methyltransferase
VFQLSFKDISQLVKVDLREGRVLVLGCGYHYPEVALWSSVVRDSVGVDVRRAFWRNGFGSLYRSLRRAGATRTRSIAEAVYRRRGSSRYYNRLNALSGADIDFVHQDLVTYDGSHLPFADESFDVVCSNAVLEHVADLDALSKDMRRVTKGGGVGYHLWHNYYSLSGGHVKDSLAVAQPWGHLLRDKAVDAHLRMSGTYTNKLLPLDIQGILSRDFRIMSFFQIDRAHNKKGLDEGFRYEGSELLTSGIRKQLSAYDDETLLTRAYLFVGRK